MLIVEPFLDYATNKLYWIDGAVNTIGSSNLDGTSRVTIRERLMDPNWLVVYGGDIYWTQGTSYAIKKLSLNAPNITQTISTDVSGFPIAIKVRFNLIHKITKSFQFILKGLYI